MASIHLIDSVLSVIGVINPLQRTFLMAALFGQSLSLSVSDLIRICTPELQLESRAKMSHFFGYFFNNGFAAFETAVVWNAQQHFSCILQSVLYIIYSLAYHKNKSSNKNCFHLNFMRFLAIEVVLRSFFTIVASRSIEHTSSFRDTY